MMRLGGILVVLACIGGCASPTPAPVIERSPVPAPPSVAAPAAPAAALEPAPVAVPQMAPVVPPAAPAIPPGSYVIRRGDTLYGIALDHGLDYRDLAAWNGIADPNVIREGQVLSLRQPPSEVQVRPVTGGESIAIRPLTSTEPALLPPPPAPDALVTEPKAIKLPYSEENLALLAKSRGSRPGEAKPPAGAPRPEATAKLEAPAKPEPPKAEPPRAEAKAEPAPKADERPAEVDAVDWSWPASGKVIATFSDPSNKGVDIAGKRGEPVSASAAGRVVYIGEGLRGYGKLVIIKHNNSYLSAYAHNDAILVKEGQTVAKGQKIAEIGSTGTGTDQTKLHFEIRRLGKPVDPLKFLPDRKS